MRRQDLVLAPARDPTARAFREARRTGVLSLPAKQLTAFPPQVYHLEEHLDKDEKKWECIDLIKIDMSHNAIPSIHDEIAALTTLVSLKLCQNAITSLPEGLYELHALVYLDLSHNQLRGAAISESLGKLRNLKELALSNNQLTQLPESLGALTQCEVLRIEDNQLSALPSTMGQLHKLHTLTAYGNALSALPPSFASLQQLQTLDLKKNRLHSVSNQLIKCQSLKYVDLRQNKLQEFPQLPANAPLDQVFVGYNALEAIDDASVLRVSPFLTVLDMRDNKLTHLPPTLAHLKKLKTLDVSNNELSDLPPSLGYLKSLNHLVLDGNPLRAIRRSILSGGCEALKKYLRTRGPPIDAAEAEEQSPMSAYEDKTPEHIFRDANASGTLDLTQLGVDQLPHQLLGTSRYDFASTLLHLTLSKNQLTHLPAEIARLTALMTLTAEENAIQSIDASIATLPRLQMLRVRKNQLTNDAINAFCRHPALRSLKELDVRNNLLTGSMPHELQRLGATLETLLLSFNRLESLEEFPWHHMSALSVLSVSDNKLKTLGCVYEAPKLASLSFENNNLTQIPCELGLCPHLRAIYMNGNPQKTVRGALIAKGSHEILQYLKNKLPPGASLRQIDALRSPAPTQEATMVVQRSMVARQPKAIGYAVDAEEEEEHPTPPPNPLRQKASTMTLTQLTQQIHAIEDQLERQSLTAAKTFALKKELAILRAQKLRHERQLDQ